MRYLIVQDWPSTSGNHTGMVHMCHMLVDLYPDNYKVLVMDYIPQYHNNKNIFKRKLLNLKYRYYDLPRLYRQKYLALCMNVFANIKVGDEFFLLEYLLPDVPQYDLAVYIRKHYPHVRIYGLVHLTPMYFNAHLFVGRMIRKWAKPIDRILTLGTGLSSYLCKKGRLPEYKISTGFHYVDLNYYHQYNSAEINKVTIIVMGNLQRDFQMVTAFKQTYIDALKQYYFVGGMPEAVQSFAEEKDFNEVREIQRRILAAYEQDFSKHAPTEIIPKIRMVWNSIPSQLAKENKKFIYGLVREGGRAKDYETAIMWLCDCGLVHRVGRVNAAGIPLKAYEDFRAFKLFTVDVGLLGCMAGLRQRTLLDGNDLFAEFKGALTEQYVCQQLKTVDGLRIYYYTNDRGSCEIDFVVDNGDQVIPVEVKAEVNLKAKSLKTYREKFNPKISVRTSMADYKKEDWLVNLPLYAVEELGGI